MQIVEADVEWVTLMALVGVYSAAVPRTVRSARSGARPLAAYG